MADGPRRKACSVLLVPFLSSSGEEVMEDFWYMLFATVLVAGALFLIMLFMAPALV